MAISDTTPDIEAMQSRIHESMSGEQRLLMALEMSYFAHELAKQGLRDAHPDWQEERVRREFLRSLFPPARHPLAYKWISGKCFGAFRSSLIQRQSPTC
jgi:hypothetical protein